MLTLMDPYQSSSGVIVKILPSIDDVAPSSKETENSRISKSTSLADSSSVKDVSSSIVWLEINSKIGASFIGLTVNVNETLSDNCVSVADTVTSILPLKLVSGVIVSWLSIKDIELFPSTSALKYKLSPSTSLADREYVKEESSSIVWSAILESKGASLTGLTVNVNEPLSDSVPSVTVIATSIFPLKSRLGETVRVLPETETEPFPSTLALNDNSSSSTSLALNSKLKSKSSSVTSENKSPKIGASFTGVTVNVKLVDTSSSPSEAVTVIVSKPL